VSNGLLRVTVECGAVAQWGGAWGRLQVGIASMWYEGNPCNMHLLDLAAEVKRGVVEAGMVGYRFNTIGVSDGMSMGTEGMSYSLQSRDLIADSVETVMGGQARARPRGRHLHRTARRADRAVARAVVRRQRVAARLRQEHAGRAHGDGAQQPAQHHGLRRHHPPGPQPAERGDAGHRVGVPELWRARTTG